ncbi:MAG: hypothetical protein CUN55_00855 [Phototrophicales bacterium]|nr:MAG: hypothetical protein CUN55_00855 [Phototrophicales bacterium]
MQPAPLDVETLIQQLRHRSKAQREAARQALIALGIQAAPQLVTRLSDPFLRDEVMLLLVKIGEPRPLVEALPTAPRHLRRHIRTVLSELGALAVPPLAHMLARPEHNAQQAAIEALAVIDHPSAHELLLQVAAGQEDQTAILAILALIDSGFDESVVRRILTLLAHPDEWVATRTFTTLLQLDDVGVVVLVSYVIKDEREFLRSMAVRAIPQLVRRQHLSAENAREVLKLMCRDESAIVQSAAAQALQQLDNLPHD